MKSLFASVHIPGKILLSGEYSILIDGCGLAVSCASDHKVSVFTSPPHDEPCFFVESNLWKEPRRYSKNKAYDYPTDFVSKTIAKFIKQPLEKDLTIKLQSESKIKGMGSSTAMRIGLYWLLHDYFKTAWTKAELTNWVIEDQKTTQHGKASGFDAICQMHGGLIEFTGKSKSEHLSYKLQQTPDFENLSRYIHLMQPGNKEASNSTLDISKNLEWAESLQKIPNLQKLAVKQTNHLKECAKSSMLSNDFYSCVGEVRKIWKDSPNALATKLYDLSDFSGCDQNWSYKPVGAGGKDGFLFYGLKKDLKEVFEHLQKNNWQLAAIQIKDDKARSIK